MMRAGAFLFGLFFCSMGLIALLGVYGYLPAQQSFGWSAKVMATLGTGVFLCAGIGMLLFALGMNDTAAKSAGFALLFFLLTFNWIAFGPGERNFTRTTRSTFTPTSTHRASEAEGRTVFGIVTGLLDLLVIYGFVSARRYKS